MKDYKGIYYGSNKEQRFFEGGAHFKYSDLYKVLKEMAKLRREEEEDDEEEEENDIFKQRYLEKEKEQQEVS